MKHNKFLSKLAYNKIIKEKTEKNHLCCIAIKQLTNSVFSFQ